MIIFFPVIGVEILFKSGRLMTFNDFNLEAETFDAILLHLLLVLGLNYLP